MPVVDEPRIIGEAGHYLVNPPERHHFLGLCDECDAHYLAQMNLERVERWYRQGVVGQDAFEAYMHVWATYPGHEVPGRVGYNSWHARPITVRSQWITDRIYEALNRGRGDDGHNDL